MKGLWAAAIAALLTGCAARQMPVRVISTSWSTVSALPPRTEIGIALDGEEIRRGRLEDVNAQGLTLWDGHGMAVIRRDRIARLAVMTPAGTTRIPHIVNATIGAGLLSAIAGGLIGAMGENGATRGAGWALFAAGAVAGAVAGAGRAPSPRYQDRVVYIRP